MTSRWSNTIFNNHVEIRNRDIHLCRKMLELKAHKYILPVEVVDPKDNVELNVEFKLSILPPWPAPPGFATCTFRPAGVKLTPCTWPPLLLGLGGSCTLGCICGCTGCMGFIALSVCNNGTAPVEVAEEDTMGTTTWVGLVLEDCGTTKLTGVKPLLLCP